MEYYDRDIEILTANIIAESQLVQVDDEGRQQIFIDEIEDHRVLSDAVPPSNSFITTHTRTKQRRRTLEGWEFLRWKD